MCAQSTQSADAITATYSVTLGERDIDPQAIDRTTSVVTADSIDAVAPFWQTQDEPTLEEMQTAVSAMVCRLIDRFDLRAGDVARILGVSASYMTNLRRGDAVLTIDSHPYQNAVLFLRTLESVNSMLGSSDAVQQYLTHKHAHLGAVPLQMMTTPEGLVDVTRYVESFVH